jgi:hypothetical protein
MATQQQNSHNKNVDGLTRRQIEENNEIFSDLDSAKNKFNGFWLVSIIILLVVFCGLIIAAANLKRANVSIANPLDNSSNNDSTFAGRLSLASGTEITTLDFSGQEFATASGADSANFPLEDSQFVFSPNQIILSGKIRDSWIPIPVHLKINAATIGSKFAFILAPNDLDNIIVYGDNQNQIQQTLDDSVNQTLSSENMIAKSVSVSNDLIEFQIIKQ